jgi:hypothetical protein
MRKCVVCQREYQESTEEQKYCDRLCKTARKLKITRDVYVQQRQEREKQFAAARPTPRRGEWTIGDINNTPMEQLRTRVFVDLKSGHDRFSRMIGPALTDAVPTDDLARIREAFPAAADGKSAEVACRWLLRGLELEKAIWKARADQMVGACAVQARYDRRDGLPRRRRDRDRDRSEVPQDY